MNRNKDSDSYIKYISVIDLIIKNSDEKNPITINQIQDLIYDKGYDFKIDFRIVKKFVENYNNYCEDTIIKTYKEGRNNYFYYENPNLDLMEAKAIKEKKKIRFDYQKPSLIFNEKIK